MTTIQELQDKINVELGKITKLKQEWAERKITSYLLELRTKKCSKKIEYLKQIKTYFELLDPSEALITKQLSDLLKKQEIILEAFDNWSTYQAHHIAPKDRTLDNYKRIMEIPKINNQIKTLKFILE